MSFQVIPIIIVLFSLSTARFFETVGTPPLTQKGRGLSKTTLQASPMGTGGGLCTYSKNWNTLRRVCNLFSPGGGNALQDGWPHARGLPLFRIVEWITFLWKIASKIGYVHWKENPKNVWYSYCETTMMTNKNNNDWGAMLKCRESFWSRLPQNRGKQAKYATLHLRIHWIFQKTLL